MMMRWRWLGSPQALQNDGKMMGKWTVAPGGPGFDWGWWCLNVWWYFGWRGGDTQSCAPQLSGFWSSTVSPKEQLGNKHAQAFLTRFNKRYRWPIFEQWHVSTRLTASFYQPSTLSLKLLDRTLQLVNGSWKFSLIQHRAATVPTELPQLLEKSPRKHPQNLQHSNPLGKLLEFLELIYK